ncbi:endonuclease/exonuclease/phosphatase family protein [Spirulina sp. CS-785/01]|uniref:endonuclease/exonuclease/phosphatase family protein n=1 Tax=Spirulina sp. CS-785/01 TaxID=3021716 RepID=UPI002330FC68|nr:endonuclease/exonuclease/phosphatase family protein [Spirulina sp. CS-785/01]MDB9314756.1 endonuclease/exonuclease/phosphatase family protein [Spirulina sp. CS-785/01]
MKRWGIILGSLGAVPILALILFYFWASSGRYPQETELVTYDTSTPPEKADGVYRVVTYNIGYLSGLTNNVAVERSESLFQENQQTAIEGLKELEPDIIALQEVDLASRRSFRVNQVAEVAKGVGLEYGAIAVNWDKNYVPFPYLPLSAHFGRILSAQAVVSHHPIQNQQRIVLEEVENKPFFYKAFYIDRLAQITEITINNRPLTLINVHLEAFEENTRRQQTEFLQELLSRYLDQTPVILLGDFNSGLVGTEENDPTIKLLLDHPQLQPAIPEKAQTNAKQFTFPSDDPVAKLDYIFYTPDSIKLREARVVEAAKQASDHLPVMMEWEFLP